MKEKMDSREVVAARLESVRAVLGIETRREFAERAGIREQDYSDWMNLRRNVPTSGAMKLCRTYSLTWEFIYFGNKDHLEHRIAMAL